MGTALVICFAIGMLLIAAGVPMRHLGVILGVLVLLAAIVALAEPYRRARLMSFADPWQDAGGDGFQAVQSMIAIGSGGFFGVGLGESVQKIFYLPEAHTDMILAIIGEELGVLGDQRARVALRADRLGRLPHREARPRPLLDAARRRDHVADPGPGVPQLLRRDGDGAADRRAAAVRLLRQLEPDRHARRHGSAAERRGERRPACEEGPEVR